MANLDFLKTEKFTTGYGNEISGATSYDEVLKQAGLNWTVDVHPAFADFNGTMIPVPKTNVVVRTEDQKPLGIVSDKYKIVNNSDAFAFTEAIYDSRDIEFICGGSYRDGSSTWLEAKVTGEYSILGDKVECYFIFMNSHDGTGSVKTLIVPNRVACSNALNLPVKNGKISRHWRCTHSGNPLEKINEASEVLLAGSSYMKTLTAECEMLQEIKISLDWLDKSINELFPITEDMTDEQKDKMIYRRDSLRDVYLFKDDLSDFGNTGYRFVSAVADYADHVECRNTKNAVLNRKMLIAHGSDLVDRAYKMAIHA